jgi:hypothetical protein
MDATCGCRRITPAIVREPQLMSKEAGIDRLPSFDGHPGTVVGQPGTVVGQKEGPRFATTRNRSGDIVDINRWLPFAVRRYMVRNAGQIEKSGMSGGVMKRAFISLVVSIPFFLIVGGCGPSGGDLKIEDLREENRVEAERAVGAKRMEEMEHVEKEAAVAAYHEWFMHEMREPSSRTRRFKDALKHVSLEDTTLVLELSTDDKEAAIELCDLTLEKWSERVRHGVSNISVVSTADGSTLAESFHTPSGTKKCQ